MKFYEVLYESEYGAASFDGDFEHYQTFIARANKAGREAGLLEDDESVLDCVIEITADGEEI